VRGPSLGRLVNPGIPGAPLSWLASVPVPLIDPDDEFVLGPPAIVELWP
jgi:hypothetical protein